MFTSIPAPWHLTGRGYILLYRFDKNFIKKHSFLPAGHTYDFAGGLGAVMFVSYGSSEAGPYDELLFIPGKFRIGGRKWHTISKIYVSTEESVVNGRKNWGIPKERASFSFSGIENNRENVVVSNGGIPIISSGFKSLGIPFPVNTRLMPFHLMQEGEGKYLQTTFQGRGTGQLVSINKLEVNSSLFPDISSLRPLVALQVRNFKITFPVAREYQLESIF